MIHGSGQRDCTARYHCYTFFTRARETALINVGSLRTVGRPNVCTLTWRGLVVASGAALSAALPRNLWFRWPGLRLRKATSGYQHGINVFSNYKRRSSELH